MGTRSANRNVLFGLLFSNYVSLQSLTNHSFMAYFLSTKIRYFYSCVCMCMCLCVCVCSCTRTYAENMIVYVRHLEKGLLHTDCSLSSSCHQDVHPWGDQAKPPPAHILYYTSDTLANRHRPWLSLNWFVQVSKNKHKCLLNSTSTLK